MICHRPPIVATWLLQRFVRQDEALTGDMLEEYRGRSVGWYWRQVLIAIVVATADVLREHKVITVRTILLGWAALYCSAYLIALPSSKLYLVLRELGLPHLFWWQHYYSYPIVLIPCVGFAASGWIVARLHRRHYASMVLVFRASFLLWTLPEFLRLTGDSISNPRYLAYLFIETINVGLAAISVLLVGLWGGQWQEKRAKSAV